MRVGAFVKPIPSRWIALAMLALCAASTQAQRCRSCLPGDDTVPRLHVLPGFGLHVGTPQKASVAAGVVLGEDWQENGRDRSRNLAVWAEPGLSAGRVAIAYIDHGYGSFGSGYGAGVTVLRTWNSPWTVRPNLTYLGAEVILWPIVFVGPRVGIFKSVSNGAPNAWFVSFDFGFGL